MKTKFFVLRSLTMLSIIGTIITGCKKESKVEEDTDTQSSVDNAFSEATYNDVQNMSEEADRQGSLSSYKMQHPQELSILSACATVTRDTVANPHTITIDFGATNCTCVDGKQRRGQIIVSYTGAYRATGTVITHTFNNYFVNDHQVTGTKTVTNNGPNNAGNLTYSIQVNGSIILANNGGTITWTSTRTREWTQGANTLTRQDDEYSITGSASGTDAHGLNYTSYIGSPLVRKLALGCKQIVSGTLLVTPSGKATRFIDFGNGSCDDQATVTINGVSRTIQLR